MYKHKKILAIVPARGGSKGIPKKNIKMLCGKPLIFWSINAGKRSKYIDKLIVSTDSLEIAEVAKQFHAEVPFIRTAELASDTASSIDVIINALDFLAARNEKFDYVLLLEPTSPLRTVEDIDLAIERLLSNKIAKSIVSVAKTESSHPAFCVTIDKDGLAKPFLKKDIKHVRRQELDEVYYLDGTLYFSEVDFLREKKTFYHDKTLIYVVERYKYLEVDEEMDLVCIEALMNWKKEAYLK